jgi:parallel beta-helix repeat protein
LKAFRTWFARERSLNFRDDDARRRALRRRRPTLDALEGRQLLTGSGGSAPAPTSGPASGAAAPPTTVVLTVTNDVDIPNPSNAAQWAIYNGSLRGAIVQADDLPTADTVVIDFDSDGGGFDTFQPVAPLPQITRPVTIDGTTQPLYKGSTTTGTAPFVQIDGGLLPSNGYYGANGLTFTSGASGSVVKGIEVTGFGYIGIEFQGASNIQLVNDTVGLQVTAGFGYQKDVVMPNYYGVEFDGGSGNVVNDLTIAGNTVDGLRLNGSSNNTVENSFIGTDSTGMMHTDFAQVSLGNGGRYSYGTGLYIFNGAQSNTVNNNVISNNGTYGVLLSGGAMYNTLTNNKIGTDVSGSYALPNQTGVMIQNGASFNNIGISGPTFSSGGNLISGNSWDGLWITGSGTEGNWAAGDRIGTDEYGNYAIPNWNGVQLTGGAYYNVLYGDMISGNASDGVFISDSNTAYNVLEYDQIGVNVLGNALGNGQNGVILVNGTSNNQVYGCTIEFSGAVGLCTYGAGGGNSFTYNNVVNNYGGNLLWD